jgi:hypothetical protein
MPHGLSRGFGANVRPTLRPIHLPQFKGGNHLLKTLAVPIFDPVNASCSSMHAATGHVRNRANAWREQTWEHPRFRSLDPKKQAQTGLAHLFHTQNHQFIATEDGEIERRSVR